MISLRMWGAQRLVKIEGFGSTFKKVVRIWERKWCPVREKMGLKFKGEKNVCVESFISWRKERKW